MMLHSELQTAVQEGIKITVLLFDNASFGCINNLQMGHGMGSFGTENRHRNPQTGQLDGPLVKVDFAQNAESYGCRAWRVHDEQSLLAALEASRAHPADAAGHQSAAEDHDPRLRLRWRTGDAQVAASTAVREAAAQTQAQVKKARQY